MSIEILDKVMLYMGRKTNDPSQGLIEYLQPIGDQLICDFLGWQVGGGTELQEFTEWYPEAELGNLRDDLVDNAPWDIIGGRAVQYGMNALNSQIIQVKQLPMRKIVQLWQNPSAWNVVNPPSFPDNTKLTEGIDYIADYSAPVPGGTTKISWSGQIRALTGAWYVSPWTGRTVQVTYQAGFTADELRTAANFPAFYPRVRLASCQTTMKLVKEAEAQQKSGNGAPGGVVTNFSLADFSVGYDAESQRAITGLELVLPRSAMRLLEPYMGMKPFG